MEAGAEPEPRAQRGTPRRDRTSANSAWAVGQTGTAGRIKTLILHWNGNTWS